LIGWFSNPRDEIEIVAGIATVVASGGSLTQSINQSINQIQMDGYAGGQQVVVSWKELTSMWKDSIRGQTVTLLMLCSRLPIPNITSRRPLSGFI